MQSSLTMHHPHRNYSGSDSCGLSICIFGLTRISVSDKSGLVNHSVSPCSSIPSPKSGCSSFFPLLPQQSQSNHLFGHLVSGSGLIKHKNKTHWLIFLPRTIPQLVHNAAHKLNTRTSVLDKSTGPFGLLSCTQQQSRHSRCCARKDVKNRASTQEWFPGMLSQPPVTCDSGIS